MRTAFVLAATIASGLLAAAPASADDDLPPAARPGQCFAKVVEPARTRTVYERVVVEPGRTDTRVIPARRHWESRPVVLEPERQERYVVPATFRDVWETVVVRPAAVRVSTIPAEYRYVSEQVVVRPPRRYWRRADGAPQYGPYRPGQTLVEPTGEVVCLVEEPAVVRTVWRRVCVRPERQLETPVPALTRQVARRVVDQPAHEEVRFIPARMGRRDVEVVDVPERVERVDTPPVVREVPRQEVVEPARTRWLPTACARPAEPPPCPAACTAPPPPPPPPCIEGDACGAPPPPPPPPGAGYAEPDEFAGAAGDTRVRLRQRHRDGRPPAPARSGVVGNPVADMERALAARGYYRGPIDGLFTPAAGDALHRFQRAGGLPQGALTRESARRLGIER